MSELATNAYNAGILLRLALNPKASPYQDKEYANLLHQMHTNPSLRVIFENFAEGLELEILDYGNHGVVLAGKEKSPFAYRMDDYLGRRSVEDRVCHGLVQLAIACYCFPTIESLDQADEVLRPRFSTDQVVEYIIDICKACKNKAGDDPEFGPAEVQLAWQSILNLPISKKTADGKISIQSLTGITKYALNALVESAMLYLHSEDDNGVFQPSPRYRIQVRKLAANESFKLVQSIIQKAENHG